MATANNKKAQATSVLVPECPVCLNDMCAPIYQCISGHSICSTCTTKLYSCPICRQNMTNTRNWQLEDLIEQLSKAISSASENKKSQKTMKIPCPNTSVGCTYILPSAQMNKHIKECIFREINCPLKDVSGNCSWTGHVKQIMQHCKQHHIFNCSALPDKDMELRSVSINKDMTWVYVTSVAKFTFIITIKIDKAKNMSYWIIQLIGLKKTAQQHIYEIHLTSKVDSKRKVVFSEHCCNDTMNADEVFRTGKCAMIPLEALTNFVKDQKLSFMFSISRLPLITKGKNNPSHVGS